jgi:hypothetical protein
MNLNQEENNFINKIIELKPSLTCTINKLKDTLAHSAPEIIKEKYWYGIFFILSTNIRINDKTDKNSNDRKIFDLYHNFIQKKNAK